MCILKAPHFRNSEHEAPGIDLQPISCLSSNKDQEKAPTYFTQHLLLTKG